MKNSGKVFYDDGLRVIKSTMDKESYANFRIVKSEDAHEKVRNLEEHEKSEQDKLKSEILPLKDMPSDTIFIRLPFEKYQFYDPMFAEFREYTGKIPNKTTRFIFSRDEDAHQLRDTLKDTDIIIIPLYDVVIISSLALLVLQKLEIGGIYYCVFTYVGVCITKEDKNNSASLN